MSERRYPEAEVAEIFRAAAVDRPAAAPHALSLAEGMTLAELQAIGGEVGLAPARIAEAAAALDLRRDAARRSDFGMPVAVRRTVDLPRAPSDREWAMLVADLRETFNARGRESSHGDVREWVNGNLHAYVEPTATGYRLRLGTTKGNALAFNRLGIAAFAAALVLLVVFALTGRFPDAAIAPVIIALLGTAALGSNALRLPAWAREREEQMEAVAARARALLAAAPQPAPAIPAAIDSSTE